MTKTLVAYFSASGYTKNIAQKIANVTKSDIYEIKPKEPYTNQDLNWTDKNSRSSVEMNDLSYRPQMIEDDFSTDNYDTIFLGFPIWWYIAPTIINTFLEKHDLSGKRIILFATSGGSRFGGTVQKLKPSVSDSTEIIEGKLLNGDPSEDDIAKWIKTL